MKTAKEVRDVWIVEGCDLGGLREFMMVTASAEYALKVMEKQKDRNPELLFSVEQWAVCGH